MFAMRRSRSAPRHGDACPKLCLPFALFRVLDLLSTPAKGRTIRTALRSTILSARLRKGSLPVAAPFFLGRRRPDAGRSDTATRRTARPEAATNHSDVGTTAPVQGIIRAVTETVPEGARSIGQRYGPKCAGRSGVVPKSTGQNEENPTESKAGRQRRWRRQELIGQGQL